MMNNVPGRNACTQPRQQRRTVNDGIGSVAQNNRNDIRLYRSVDTVPYITPSNNRIVEMCKMDHSLPNERG